MHIFKYTVIDFTNSSFKVDFKLFEMGDRFYPPWSKVDHPLPKKKEERLCAKNTSPLKSE